MSGSPLDLTGAKVVLEMLRGYDRERRDASADAETKTAGMREVALFRAANYSGLMGQSALGLAEQLVAALEREQARPEWTCPNCGAVTRARMADHGHAEDHALADALRALLGEDNGQGVIHLGPNEDNGGGYLILDQGAVLTPEQYDAVKEAMP